MDLHILLTEDSSSSARHNCLW